MPRTQGGSISQKLTWMNMLVTGIALLLACSSFVVYDMISFREATAHSLSTQAQMIGASSASALLFNDALSAESTLSVLRSAPNVLSAAIYTIDGQEFAVYRRDRNSQIKNVPQIPPGRADGYRFDIGTVSAAHLILFQGKPTGVVYLQSDLQRLYDRFKRYGIIACIVLIVSFIVAFTISRPFQRTISQPIANLANVARTVSRERDYSVRASQEGNRGEIAVLTESFNEMLEQIQQREKALQTAHQDLERRVEERTVQLAAANRELEAFSYSVSHDLRAPLRSIDGFSQAILEDCGDALDAAARGHLKRVRAATQRMSTLIDDLLNLSRVTRSEMRKERVDLSLLAASVVKGLEEEQPRQHMECVIAKGLVAEGDPQLLRVVMENLLSNAWKYTSRHTHAKIEFGQYQNGGRPAYFVRDDGAGFDSQYTDRLFGAFQRLHGINEFPGTGIGLATVQRIIHRHGGQVWAEGVVEKGAAFYFTL